MNRLAVVCAVFGAIVLAGAPAGAVVVTFSFDPNEWINSYSTDITQTRLEQESPRILINGVVESTDTTPRYHTTYAGASYSSTGIDGFVNGVDDIEVHKFNMWLADGINAPNWGEVLTQEENTTPSGTAANGWAVETFDNPWPHSGYGTKLVKWYDAGYYDDDPNTPANPLVFNGADFDPFTLTVDLDTVDVNGNPVDLSPGSTHTIWLGCMLPQEWTADPDDLVYADNWRYEGTMSMTVVPEPITMLAVALGVGGLGGYVRKRNRA